MDIAATLDAVIVLVIIGAQVRYFLGTRAAAMRLEELFPFERPLASISPVPSATLDESVSAKDAGAVRIVPAGVPSPGFTSILDAINRYLDRSNGMPVTFLVLQDIVERTFESYEQAAVATVTLPLYIGLMGTFLGVIVGLVGLAAGRAPSVEDSDLRRFLTGVLVAMCGSLFGLLLYVAGRRFLSRAQAAAGARKRDFYIFLQSELLPVAGQEIAAALYSLQANLHTFNQDFRANLGLFGTAMEAPAHALQEQRELLKVLETTDLKRIIAANAEMLKALQAAAPTLQGFLEATRRFTVDLEATRELTAKVSGLLDRVGTFEDSVNGLGQRLQSDSFVTDNVIRVIGAQLDALESRKKLIVQFTDVQDADIRNALQEQQTGVKQLLLAANQEIATAGQELSRFISAVVGADKTNELFSNIALLQQIAQRIEASHKSLEQIASEARPDPRVAILLQKIASTQQQDPRVAVLLERMLAVINEQASRPSLGHFLHRILPGDKAKPKSNAD